MTCVLPLLVLLCSAPIDQARTPAEHQARLEEWVGPLAEKLLATLPEPIDGLAAFAPWDYDFTEPPNWGCPMGCTQLTQVLVSKSYVVYEADLPARVEAAAAKALANATRIVQNPSDTTLMAAQNALDEDQERLMKSVRRITVEIHINGDASLRRGVERAPTAAGAVAGYPVKRFAFSDESYEPTPEGVRLSFLIGPEAFRNARVKDNSEMKTEARTAVVSVSLTSRASTVKADEALARKLLERINVAVLAKLLTP
jgi:hypothetical protein